MVIRIIVSLMLLLTTGFTALKAQQSIIPGNAEHLRFNTIEEYIVYIEEINEKIRELIILKFEVDKPRYRDLIQLDLDLLERDKDILMDRLNREQDRLERRRLKRFRNLMINSEAALRSLESEGRIIEERKRVIRDTGRDAFREERRLNKWGFPIYDDEENEEKNP